MSDKLVRIEELRMKLLATATLLDIEEGNDDRRNEQGVRALQVVNDRVEFENMVSAIGDPGPMLTPSIGYIQARDSFMFYPGMMHSVFGAASAGKSLLLTKLIGDELVKGSNVMWLDAEVRTATHPLGQRLHAMGYDESIGERLWFALINRPMSLDNRDMFATTIANDNIDIVVMDSLGEFIGMQGGDANRDQDIVKALRFFEPLAAAGAAVVFIDHPSKGDTWSAAGSARKGNHVDVSYAVNPDLKRDDREGQVERSFSRWKAGYSRIFCTKDRHGMYADYECITRMTVTPTDNGEHLYVDFEADYGDDIDEMIEDQTNRQQTREASPEAKILAYAADGAPITPRTVVNAIKAAANQKEANALLKRLAAEGKLAYSKVTETYGVPLQQTGSM